MTPPLYECHGGPLDGSLRSRSDGQPTKFVHDDGGTKHYYELLFAKRLYPRMAELTFWSWRGTDRKKTNDFPITAPHFPE